MTGKHPGGRPSKLTDTICDNICKDVREGIPPATAAQLNGIHRSTYERWLKRGREAKRKTMYREFCDKINAAKSYAEKKHLHRIMESKDWKAQKYLLTLLNKDYALPDKVEVKQEVDAKVDVKHDIVKLPDDPELRIRGRDLIRQIRTGQVESSKSGDGDK